MQRKGTKRQATFLYSASLPLTLLTLLSLAALAAEAGCTPAQLALAWVLARGEHIVPIPGTSRLDHLQDDLGAAALELPAEVLQRAGALINEGTVSGARYNAQNATEVDTESF